MLFDHTVTWLVPAGSVPAALLHIPGRVTAPVMCYFIAEGYFHTSDIKKYITRLFFFAALSHFPYTLYFGVKWHESTGVIWGLAFGLIALTAVECPKLTALKKLIILAFCCLLAIPADWYYISVLWIVGFGIFRGRFRSQMIIFIIIGFLFHAIPVLIRSGPAYAFQFGIVLAIPLLALYKGRRGKKSQMSKWLFYIFYPVHLLILYILKNYVF